MVSICKNYSRMTMEQAKQAFNAGCHRKHMFCLLSIKGKTHSKVDQL